MMTSDIVIVGGGVVGASVAWHLTQRGMRRVTVIEREHDLGLGSTSKATGGVRAQFETEINVRLSLYSIDFFRNVDFETGYEPRGYLFLATDEAQMDFLRRSSALQHELGHTDVSIVDRRAVAAMVPGLNTSDIIGGSFGPTDGFIDPLAIMSGFATQAVAAGARIETANEVRALTTLAGRLTGVETDRGQINCDAVVVCAGAWARPVAATADIDLPVEPLRRQIVWARSAIPLPPDLPMVIDLSDGFHFRPARGSRDEVLFAYPDTEVQPGPAIDFDEGFIPKVYEKARHRAPFLAETTVVRDRCRAGLYENSPDHHAILGGCEVAGLYFACGFSGHGVMHSPATGRALAETILDGRATFLDVSSLRLSRFAEGKLLHETAFI